MSNPEWANVPVEHAGVGIDVNQPDYRIAPKPITPEQQAVIDAAIAWNDSQMVDEWDARMRLINSVSALKSKQ